MQECFQFLKSKHRTFFYTLIWMWSEDTCSYIILFLGIPALIRVYNMSAECTTKRKSSFGVQAHYSGGGEEYTTLSSTPFSEPFCSSIFTGKPQNNVSWSLIPAYSRFNPPPHFRNLSTNQSISVLSLLNIFTVLNTHTANQNVYEFL